MKGTVLSLNIPKIITSLTLPDAKAPIVALETTVTGGRTIQAKKRGGKNEARERLIEEASGAVFWLWGVSTINNYIDSGRNDKDKEKIRIIIKKHRNNITFNKDEINSMCLKDKLYVLM